MKVAANIKRSEVLCFLFGKKDKTEWLARIWKKYELSQDKSYFVDTAKRQILELEEGDDKSCATDYMVRERERVVVREREPK